MNMKKNSYVVIVLFFFFSPLKPLKLNRMTLNSRVEGCILGAALGDALGMHTEFKNLKEIYKEFGPGGLRSPLQLPRAILWTDSAGKRFMPYTDDTQMARLVFEVMLQARKNKWDVGTTMGLLAVKFVEWYDDPDGGQSPGYPYGRSPGIGVKAGCAILKERLQRAYPEWGVRWWNDNTQLMNRLKMVRKKLGETWWCTDAKKVVGGSGSVMRVWPVGIVFYDDLKKVEQFSIAQSRLTHEAPIALAASAALGVGVAGALQGEDPWAIVQEMRLTAQKYDQGTANLIEDAAILVRDDGDLKQFLQVHQGWDAKTAIADGAALFIESPYNLKRALALGVNTAGDSDTIASIAGALVGARNGSVSLPTAWYDKLENKDILCSLGKEFVDSLELISNENIKMATSGLRGNLSTATKIK